MALFSTPQTTQQIPLGFTPQQSSALQNLLQTGMGGLQNLAGSIGQDQFSPIAQEATRRFEQETVPGLAERFTSLGGGARQSSGFQQTVGQAGAGLQSQLAALQSQMGMQQRGQDIGLLQNLLGLGLTPQYQTQVIPAQRGELSQFGGQLGSTILRLLPFLIGALAGGPAGAAGGAAVGGGLNALLSNMGS